jgi:type IV pilus assembly protein PilB
MATAPKLESMTERDELSHEDIEFLKITYLFQGLGEDFFSSTRTLFEKEFFEVGEPISLETEASDHVYFIRSGAVEIVRYVPEVKQVARLVLLRTPAHFSEFSVLTQGGKSGSAFAIEPTEVLKISGEAFLFLLKSYPVVSERLAKYLATLHLRSTTAKASIQFYQAKFLEFRKELAQLLPPALWKKQGVLPLALDNNVLRVALKEPFSPAFYDSFKLTNPNLIVNSCLINDEDFDSLFKKLSQTSLPPSSTAKDALAQVFTDLKSLLKSNLLFSHFPDDYLDQLIPHFKAMQLKPGEKVFSPNTTSGNLYLVHTGKISLHRPLVGTAGFSSAGEVRAGEHFGEIALLTDSHHHLLAQASRISILYTLPKEIMGHLLASAEFCLRLSQGIAQKIQRRSAVSGITYFSSKDSVAVKELSHILPISVIVDQKVVPLRLSENEVTLGIAGADRESVFPLVGRYLLDHRIRLEMVLEADYLKWSREFQAIANSANATVSASPVTQQSAQSTVVILEELIAKGFHERASDVHFECGEDIMVVRFRVDGVLKEHSEKYPKTLAKEILSRIKVMSQMDISNHFIPQDGQLKLKIGEASILARVSYIPTKNGEKMVLRLIRTKNSIIPYNMLAPDRRLISILREVTRSNQGLFLITGPTGSGKSTTLYSVLNELNRSDANVITLEDPVEMNISGINQVEVNEKTGMTFGKALRSVLRQDPDVIMVGEVRDEESAQIVFKAAITGHLVLSTLHTNSSLDVTPRLKEMGVPPGTIAAGLIGVLAQRLVRRLCKSCTELRPIEPHEISLLKKHLQLTTFPEKMMAGKGCSKCKDTGFYDRIPVYEVWRKTPEIKNLLTLGASYEDLKAAVKNDNFVSMMECGLQMALNGLTAVDEVMRCISEA